eukprot:1159478-Pelagomonas_calceolata.AAC.6
MLHTARASPGGDGASAALTSRQHQAHLQCTIIAAPRAVPQRVLLLCPACASPDDEGSSPVPSSSKSVSNVPLGKASSTPVKGLSRSSAANLGLADSTPSFLRFWWYLPPI